MAGHNAFGAANQGALLRIYKIPMTRNVAPSKGLCKSFSSFSSLDAASLSEGGGEACQVIWGRGSVLNYWRALRVKVITTYFSRVYGVKS